MSQDAADRCQVRAPATLANFGPGFDVFGLALAEPADHLEARRLDEDGVRVAEVRCAEGPLSADPLENTAALAAGAALARLRDRVPGPLGVELRLEKGIPLASGLGSSAASAAAGARAIDLLWPGLLTEADLLEACLVAEAAVSGRHLDNAAPALLGGFVLVEGVEPPRVHRVEPSLALDLVVVKPAFGVETRKARAAMPDAVPRADWAASLADVAGVVHALHAGDRDLLVRSLVDRVALPARRGLIDGFDAAAGAAREAGAEATGISGAGPTLFALVPDPEVGEAVAAAVTGAWHQVGHAVQAWVTRASPRGAHGV